MASEPRVGKFSTVLKLELYEAVICPSLHYNIQAWHFISVKGINELEARQGRILKRLLELPQSISTKGVLYETGIWPVKEKIVYKKIMLLHNILRSDDERIIKKIVLTQDRYQMPGSWYTNLKEEARTYEINVTVECIVAKSKAMLKKEVKSKIEGYIEKQMKEKHTPKMRSVIMGTFGRKSYLEGELSKEEVTKALKIKLHMVQAQANYGQKICVNFVCLWKKPLSIFYFIVKSCNNFMKGKCQMMLSPRM